MSSSCANHLQLTLGRLLLLSPAQVLRTNDDEQQEESIFQLKGASTEHFPVLFLLKQSGFTVQEPNSNNVFGWMWNLGLTHPH